MCKCPAVARGGWAQLELTDALPFSARKEHAGQIIRTRTARRMGTNKTAGGARDEKRISRLALASLCF